MSTLRQQFEAVYGPAAWTGIDRVCVGFSGGPDSTALLLLLKDQPVQVEAVYLHHGLRTAADDERAWCANFCRRRGIRFRSVMLDVPTQRDKGESTEMAARRLRLRYWREQFAGLDNVAVALGHHADDELETMLLRLLRGSNASGLTGLRPRRRIDRVLFLRPLLPWRRADILDFLAAEGVDDCCHDASNAAPDFLRNRVRHELLPLMREIAGNDEGLRTTLDHLREDAACLETGLDDTVMLADALATPALRRLSRAVQVRFLQGWLTAHGVEPAAPALERLLEVLAGPPRPDAWVDVGGDLFVREDDGALVLERGGASTPDWEYHWYWRREAVFAVPEAGLHLRARRLPADEKPHFAFAGTDLWPAAGLPPFLILRARQPGDRMIPFGGTQPVRLKKLIGQAGVEARRHVCVVCRPDGEILWVPGVRRAAGPVTGDDDALVELAFSVARGKGMAW